MTNNKTNVLYLAYDGMTDPLGQSQVLSYLKGLSRFGFSFDVISFEKPQLFESRKKDIETFIEGYDIRWFPLPYHKKPPILSTVYDIKNAWSTLQKLYLEKKYTIVHCRGYTLASLGVKAKEKYGSKFIFDMRGWWPDEKLESGLWASPLYKPIYKYFKAQEKRFFKAADIAISLTYVGQATIESLGLKNKNNVAVIPTCVNFDVFPPFDEEKKTEMRKKLNIPVDATVLLYSGSVGANYRTDLVLKFFSHLLTIQKNSYLFFLSHAEHGIIEEEVQKAGIDPAKIRLQSAKYEEVSSFLMVGDIGVVMYNSGFSVIGRSPTKLGEYWASGLTVLSANDIGDLSCILNQYPAGGVLVKSIADQQDYPFAIDAIVKMQTPKATLRDYADNYFSLDSGIRKYYDVYKTLIAQ